MGDRSNSQKCRHRLHGRHRPRETDDEDDDTITIIVRGGTSSGVTWPLMLQFWPEAWPFTSVRPRSRSYVKVAIKTPLTATASYTVQEIASIIKVSPAFIYREIKRGNLTAIRHNSRILRIRVEA